MELKREKLEPELFAFDIDGVVADTMGTFIEIATNEYGIEGLKKENITSYWLEKCLPVPEKIVWEIVDRIIKDPFDIGLRPIEGALEGLRHFYEQAGRLTFVTARPEKDGIEAWLQEQLFPLPGDAIRVVATGVHEKKADVLLGQGFRYFVEDNLDTVRQLCDHGIGAIVFDQPWNREETPFRRVFSWDDLLELAGMK